MKRSISFVSDHPVAAVFLLALTTRVVAALVITVFFDGAVAMDDLTYSQMAMQAADGQTAGWDPYTHFLYSATATFLVPLTLVFKLFGSHTLAGQLFVGLLGAGAAAATTKVALEFLERRWAVACGLVVALLPSQIVWSSAILKDAAVWLLMAAIAVLVAAAGRREDKNLIWIAVASALLLWLLAYLRLHSFVIACWALAIASLFGIARLHWLRVAGAVLIAVSVPWLVGAGPAGADFVANAGSLGQRRMANAIGANSAIVGLVVPSPQSSPVVASGLERPIGAGPEGSPRPDGSPAPDASGSDGILDVAWGFETGGEPVPGEAAPPPPPPPAAGNEPGLLSPDIRHLPRGIEVVLLEPFPGRGGSTQLRLASMESLIWYPLLILAAIGLYRSRKWLRCLAFPILAGGGVLVTYALTEGNVGTAFRHRGELVWVVALLAATGAQHLARRRLGPPEPAPAD